MTPLPQFRPWLIASGLAYAVLTVSAWVIGVNLPRARPGGPASDVLRFVQGHATAMRLLALISLLAAVALAIWAAAAYQYLRALGVTTVGAGLVMIGGTLASGFSALTGSVGWVGSNAGDSAPVAAAFRDTGLMTGGPGFAVFFGLLIAGVSLPMLQMGMRRRWAIFGLVLAVISQLAPLGVLLDDPSAPKAVPAARFVGLVWVIGVSVVLPAAVARVRAGDASLDGVRPVGTGPAQT